MQRYSIYKKHATVPHIDYKKTCEKLRFSFPNTFSPHRLFLGLPAIRQRKGKIFAFSFRIALALHYLWIRQAAARQCERKNLRLFLSHCARLALSLDKTGGGSAMREEKSSLFPFALRSPCTIFAFEKKNGHQIINISVEFLLPLQ